MHSLLSLKGLEFEEFSDVETAATKKTSFRRVRQTKSYQNHIKKYARIAAGCTATGAQLQGAFGLGGRLWAWGMTERPDACSMIDPVPTPSQVTDVMQGGPLTEEKSQYLEQLKGQLGISKETADKVLKEARKEVRRPGGQVVDVPAIMMGMMGMMSMMGRMGIMDIMDMTGIMTIMTIMTLGEPCWSR
jgi:hypothetical protein